MKQREYLTPNDVREALSIGRSLVYQLFNSKDFPAIRLGRKLLVRADMLDKWLSSHNGLDEMVGGK